MQGINAGTVFVDVVPNMAGFSTKLAAGVESGSIGSKLSGVGRALTKTFTVPILALGAASTKFAIDFQKNMEMIHTQAGASQQEVTKLNSAVLDLAKSTQQGPNELAKGLFHIESVGYRGAEAMRVLKVASDGAAVGNVDLEQTATALAAVVRTNIKGAADYRQAMGALNATVGAGNMRFSDLLEALKSGVMPTAKAVGLSLTGLTAALATMTDEGVPAGIAATRLRTIMLMMVNPTQKATGVLKDLGLGQLSLAKEMRKPDGFLKALQLLEGHMKNIHSQSQRAADIAAIFGGSRSAGTILMLANNMGFLQKKYEQINHTAGNFNQDVAAQQQTELAKLNTAWSTIQATMIQVGGTLAPFVSTLATHVSSAVSSFDSLGHSTQTWLLIMAGVAAAIGPVISIFGAFASVGTVVSGGLLAIIGIMPGFEVAMEGGAASIVAFGGAIDIALPELALIAIGITAVGAAVAGILGWLGQDSSGTQALADASNEARDAVSGLNAAIDAGKKDHQDAVAAHHRLIASTHQVTDAQQAYNQAVKEYGKNSKQAIAAHDQLNAAEDNHVVAMRNNTDAQIRSAKQQEQTTNKIIAARAAVENLATKYQNKLLPALKQTGGGVQAMSAVAAGNARIQAKNNQTLDEYRAGLEATAASLDKQASHLQKNNPILASALRQTAQAAHAADLLTQALGRIPTLTQVNIELQIEASMRNVASSTGASHGHGKSGLTDKTRSKGSATGGPAYAGVPTIVGDGVGPEVFVPHVDGHIYKDVAAHMPSGGGGSALTITNWEDGTGYIEDVSDMSIGRAGRLNRQTRRMHR